MKSRTVFVTLELETTKPLNQLRSQGNWQMLLGLAKVDHSMWVLQAQANVAQRTKKKRRSR